MNPKYWGPNYWKVLHSVSFNYPKNPSLNDKKKIKLFFYNLANTLPCIKCQKNYRRNIEINPIHKNLGSRSDLIKWVIDLHNCVNLELGKKQLTYKEAIDKCYINCKKYISKKKRIDIKNNYKLIYLFIIFIIFIIILNSKKIF